MFFFFFFLTTSKVSDIGERSSRYVLIYSSHFQMMIRGMECKSAFSLWDWQINNNCMIDMQVLSCKVPPNQFFADAFDSCCRLHDYWCVNS